MATAPAQAPLPGPNKPAAPAKKATFEQDVSYALGLSMGRDLVTNQVPVDANYLVAGLMDALQKKQPRMSEQQVTATITRFEKIMQQKAESKMAELSAKNKEIGAAFLAENGEKADITTTPSGLQYRVLQAGTGATPNARSRVRCNYEGKLINGNIFDSSYKRGQPAEFPVSGVIGGWTEVLQLMKEGGSVEVYIPSDLGYGDRGFPPEIAPGETLIFKIELIKVL